MKHDLCRRHECDIRTRYHSVVHCKVYEISQTQHSIRQTKPTENRKVNKRKNLSTHFLDQGQTSAQISTRSENHAQPQRHWFEISKGKETRALTSERLSTSTKFITAQPSVQTLFTTNALLLHRFVFRVFSDDDYF